MGSRVYRELVMRSKLFVLLFVSSQAFGRWDVVSQAGGAGGNCGWGACYVQDSNSGLIWANTVGKTNVLGIGGPSQHFTQAQAAQNCAAFGYRLPTAAEFSAAISNGLAQVNNRHPGFGDRDWFFWTSDPGIAMSIEAPFVNPVRGQQLTKYKCVKGAGAVGNPVVNPVVTPPPAEIVQQLNQTATETSNEAQTFIQELQQLQTQNFNVANLDLPQINAVNTGGGAGTIQVVTPQRPGAQATEQHQQETHIPAHGGQGSGANVGGNPGRISNAWRLGSDYFGAGFGYTLSASPNLNASARAEVTGKLLRKAVDLVSIEASTTNGGNRLNLQASPRLFGNAVPGFSDSLPLGNSKNIPGKVLFNQRQTLATLRFFVGPVPVALKAGTQGELGYKPTNYYAYLQPGQQNAVQFGVKGVPYTAAGAWGSAAADIYVAALGVRANMNLVSGNLSALVSYSPTRGAPCFANYLNDVTMLNGRFGVFVEWREVTTQIVTTIVDGVCRWIGGSWFGREVCGRAKEVTERVQKFTSVQREQTLYNWKGKRLMQDGRPSYRWYDNCPR